MTAEDLRNHLFFYDHVGAVLADSVSVKVHDERNLAADVVRKVTSH